MNVNDEDVEEQRPESMSFWSCVRRHPHWKCVVISVLIYICLSCVAWCRVTEVSKLEVNFSSFPIAFTRRASPCEEGYLYIPLAFLVTLYLVYLVECWHCTVRLDLRSRIHVDDAYAFLESMKEATPVIWWKAICYHYVRRTRQVTRYRNGDAYTTTQIYYERINSHIDGSAFMYTQCGVRDVSKRLVDLDKFPVTRLKLSKSFAFANEEAALEFEEQRARFFQENELCDDYMEMREGLDLLNINFKETALAFTEPLPWYVSQSAFWLASALLLSWPLRLLLATKTAHVHYHVTKLFGVNYGETPQDNTTTPVDIEWNITTNNALVPSYSEAILFAEPATTTSTTATTMTRHNSTSNVNNNNNNALFVRGNRHSWGACNARWTLIRTIPKSITRISLQQRIVYHATPLLGNAFVKTPEGPPPTYDVAVRICRPITLRGISNNQINETQL